MSNLNLSEQEIQRRASLQALRDLGIDPYPAARYDVTATAAQLAAGEFVNSALKVIFLLNRKYMPYYKWSFLSLSRLSALSELYSHLEWLISNDNSESSVKRKKEDDEEIVEVYDYDWLNE